jgi:hypothetical protein
VPRLPAPELVEHALRAHVDRCVLDVGCGRAVPPTRWGDEPGRNEVVQPDRGHRLERTELGDRRPVHGHDHALAACGAADDGGDVVPQLPDPDAFDGRMLASA